MDINVLALIKGNQRYVCFYDNESRKECVRVFNRFVSNSGSNFTIYDVAFVAGNQYRKQKSPRIDIFEYNYFTEAFEKVKDGFRCIWRSQLEGILG